ncbi:MAG: alcohol dehydrogenase catalytic domain-containing protein [Magnetococcales bacterium]|nr:alcohol dehydrogenase catalytic domain-containing protein [Magnetococcales bacterium]MBF0322958.1 alcohol dehydrogenase catalytic domain-containing protein [Magnetococcales bacterium]
MRGLFWNGRWQLRHDLPLPEVPPGEALIRIRLAGICGTDLAIARGYLNFQGIPGHEFVGDVVAPQDSAWHGRRVVGEINGVCGTCPPCQRQEQSHCLRRTTLGIRGRQGVFADYCLLPLANLHAVPEAITDTMAVFVEPLAAAQEIVQQCHIRPTDRVMVVGDGRLGQLIARVLRLTGCDLTVVGHHPDKLQPLAKMGMSTCLEASSAMGQGSADWVVECTGRLAGWETARRLVRPRGTIVLKSTLPEKALLDTSAWVVDEITVRGSRCGPFPPALRLLAAGLIPVTDLVEEVHPLSDGVTAMERAGRHGARKVLIRMD